MGCAGEGDRDPPCPARSSSCAPRRARAEGRDGASSRPRRASRSPVPRPAARRSRSSRARPWSCRRRASAADRRGAASVVGLLGVHTPSGPGASPGVLSPGGSGSSSSADADWPKRAAGARVGPPFSSSCHTASSVELWTCPSRASRVTSAARPTRVRAGRARPRSRAPPCRGPPRAGAPTRAGWPAPSRRCTGRGPARPRARGSPAGRRTSYRPWNWASPKMKTGTESLRKWRRCAASWRPASQRASRSSISASCPEVVAVVMNSRFGEGASAPCNLAEAAPTSAQTSSPAASLDDTHERAEDGVHVGWGRRCALDVDGPASRCHRLESAIITRVGEMRPRAAARSRSRTSDWHAVGARGTMTARGCHAEAGHQRRIRRCAHDDLPALPRRTRGGDRGARRGAPRDPTGLGSGNALAPGARQAGRRRWAQAHLADGGRVRARRAHGAPAPPRGVPARRDAALEWWRAYEEAHLMEHAISDHTEALIVERLGDPFRLAVRLPGSRTPARAEAVHAARLSDLEAGDRAVVQRVYEEDEQLLRFFDGEGIRPGAHLLLREVAPYRGTVTIDLGERESRPRPRGGEAHLGRGVGAPSARVARQVARRCRGSADAARGAPRSARTPRAASTMCRRDGSVSRSAVS